MWTPDALRSEAHLYAGTIWRMVESQAQVSTMRITDDLLEQQILEQEIETVKPPLPEGTDHLHPLLKTPFRYEPYDSGSRFRRAHQKEGAFYGSEAVETAIAELAFYRILFVAEAPGMTLPDRALEFTAFAVGIETDAVDLTRPRLNADRDKWTDPRDYTACQDMADAVRAAAIGAIRYQSVRDPAARANVALLDWRGFTMHEPQRLETWHLFLRPCRAHALREFPRLSLEFTKNHFGNDGRLDAVFAGCPEP